MAEKKSLTPTECYYEVEKINLRLNQIEKDLEKVLKGLESQGTPEQNMQQMMQMFSMFKDMGK